jgi:ribokinase
VSELRFAVVGAYVADCLVRTPRIPGWGEEILARSIRTAPGGKALNQAVALARLGARVSAVGVVGDDGVGRDVLAALGREGIDADGVERRAGVPTPNEF